MHKLTATFFRDIADVGKKVLRFKLPHWDKR